MKFLHNFYHTKTNPAKMYAFNLLFVLTFLKIQE